MAVEASVGKHKGMLAMINPLYELLSVSAQSDREAERLSMTTLGQLEPEGHHRLERIGCAIPWSPG